MKKNFTMCAASIQLSEDRIQSTKMVSLASFMNRGYVRLRIASKQLDDGSHLGALTSSSAR
jgi:hypothetical protein